MEYIDRKKSDSIIQHGIYYLLKNDRETGQVRNGNPVIVLSKPAWNGFAHFVQIVSLSTKNLQDDPVNVRILSSGRASFAVCNQVTKIDVAKLGDFISIATQEEISNIKKGIAVHFGMTLQSMPAQSPDEAANAKILDLEAKVISLCKELNTQTVAANTYQSMYQQLLDRVLNGKHDGDTTPNAVGDIDADLPFTTPPENRKK